VIVNLSSYHENVFAPCQFSSIANVEAHALTTGPEIWWQLRSRGLIVDAFVAGVGTGGTVMGVGQFLRGVNPQVRVHPLQPAESPILTTRVHTGGEHRIQGISDEFVPPIVDLDALDEIVSVHDGDAILMAQKLARELGLAVGISSGANFLGALLAQNDLGAEAVVATVFADDNKKYLSTDLLNEEPLRTGYLTPEVTFLGVEAIGRTCHLCEGQTRP
jgi:cysteine synthase A